MQQSQPVAMSYTEYLAREDNATVRHEYLRGLVWAMAGGTIEHGRLASAMALAIGTALRGRSCAAFSSDVRIRIDATDRTTYPDLSVVCGPRETSPIDSEALINPIVIVEVLSDSTEASDRGEKFAHYRRIKSLREYVLVSQNEPHIEVYRLEGERWTLYEARADEHIRLESIGVDLSINDIFDDPTRSTE